MKEKWLINLWFILTGVVEIKSEGLVIMKVLIYGKWLVLFGAY